jgi:DNA helicase HerA-like ATPase
VTSTTETQRTIDLTSTSAEQRLEMIHKLRSSIMLPPIAYSIDGRILQLEAPLHDAPLVGDHVVIDRDGTRLLAQVTSGDVELRQGPQIALSSTGLGMTGSTMQLRVRSFTGTAVVLGVLDADGFLPLRDAQPLDETAVVPATDSDVRAYNAWARASSGRASLDMGREPRLADERVHLQAKGLTRHTLFCGQSGSGKTFSLGVLLERVLLDTSLPMVVLDPNSDHVHLGTLRSRDDAERVRATPYDDAEWSAIERAHAAAADGVRVVHEADAAVAARITGDARTLVLDMGSLSDAAARHETAASMLHHLWDTRRDRDPVLIVLDEAHDICPAEPVSDVQRQATELAIAIAGEGRKFGRHLLLSTQRPQKLHPNVVSQCDNLVLLRMNSALDVADLAGTFSHLPSGLLFRAPTFDQGMAIVGGPLVPYPTLLRIDGRLTPEGGSDVPVSWA